MPPIEIKAEPKPQPVRAAVVYSTTALVVQMNTEPVPKEEPPVLVEPEPFMEFKARRPAHPMRGEVSVTVIKVADDEDEEDGVQSELEDDTHFLRRQQNHFAKRLRTPSYSRSPRGAPSIRVSAASSYPQDRRLQITARSPRVENVSMTDYEDDRSEPTEICVKLTRGGKSRAKIERTSIRNV